MSIQIMENTPRKSIRDTRTKTIRSEDIEDRDTNRDKSGKTIRKKLSVSAKKSSALLPSARKLTKARNLNNVLKTITIKKMADNNSSKNASTKSFANFSNLNAKKPGKAAINSNGLVNSRIINKATNTKTSKSEDTPMATKVSSNRLLAKNGQIPTNSNPKSGPPRRLTTKKNVSEVSLALKKVVPSNTSATKRAESVRVSSRGAASSKSFESNKISGANSIAPKRTTSTASLENNKGDNLPTKKIPPSTRLATRGNISTKNSKIVSSTAAIRRDVFARSLSTRSRTTPNTLSTRSRTTPNTLATKKMACKLIDYRESGSSKSLATIRKAPTNSVPANRAAPTNSLPAKYAVTSRNSAIARNLPSLPSSSGLTSKKTTFTNSTAGKVPTAATRFPNIKRLDTNLTKHPALSKKSTATKNGNSDAFKKLSQAKRLDKTKVEGSNTNPVSRLKKASVDLDKIPVPSSWNKESKTGLRPSGSERKSLSVTFDKKSLSSHLGHSTTLFKSPTRPMMTMKSTFLPQLDNPSSRLPNLVVPVLSTIEEINSIKESVALEEDSEINDETIKVMLENAEKIWDKNVSNFSRKPRTSKKTNFDKSILNLSKIGEESEVEDSDLEDTMNNQSLQNKLQEQNYEIDNVVDQLAKCLQKNQQLNDEVKMLKSKNKNLKLESKKLITIETKKQTHLLKKMNIVENENFELSNLNKSLEALVSELRKDLLDHNNSFEFEQQELNDPSASVLSSSSVVNSEDESIKNIINDIIDSAVESYSQDTTSIGMGNIKRTVNDILWDMVQNIIDANDLLDNGLQQDGTDDTAKLVEYKLTTIKINNSEKGSKLTLKRKCSYEISKSPLAKRKKFETEELLTDDTDKWTKDVVHDLVCDIEKMDDELKAHPYLDASKKCIGDVFLDIMNKIEVCDTQVKTKTFSVDEILMDILDAITEEKNCKSIYENKPDDDNECRTPVKMLKLDIGRTFLDLMNKMDEKHSEVKSKTFSMDELLIDIVDTVMDGKDRRRTQKRRLDEIECQSDAKKFKFGLQLPLPWE